MARSFQHNDDDDPFDENGLLRDGKSVRLPMMLRDSMREQRSHLHDGLGGIPGHRPSYAFVRDDVSRARVAAAYEAYETSVQGAWRNPVEVADEATDTAIADAAAHADRTPPRPVEEVYRLYDEALCAAWKSPRS